MNFKSLLLTTALFLNLSVYSVCSAELKAVYTQDDAYPVASKLSYDYFEGSIYTVNTQIGHVTDITLHPGDNLIGVIGGDTKQWSIDKARVNDTTHVYIKPLVENISTDIIINSDKRSYHLLVNSNSTYNPIIEFEFINERYKKIALTSVYKDRKEKEYLDIFTEKKNGQLVRKKINSSYEVKPNKSMDEKLLPKKVFDDGVRTYIQMPQTNQYDLPVLYTVDDRKKLSLVNYRVKGKYYIADRIFTHARLQYSSKFSVDITPKKEMESGINAR